MEKLFKKMLDIILPEKEGRFLAKKIDAEELQNLSNLESSEKTSCFSIFKYKDPIIRNFIWNIKYKGCLKSARKAAEVLYPHLIDEIAERNMFGEKDIPILEPIPLFKRKERERGFNQSERICGALQKIDGESFISQKKMLKRVKNTKSQTEMESKREREENIRNAFEVVNKESVRGKTIILIDDVITTGATMREARKTLLNSGVKDVICFALARG